MADVTLNGIVFKDINVAEYVDKNNRMAGESVKIRFNDQSFGREPLTITLPEKSSGEGAKHFAARLMVTLYEGFIECVGKNDAIKTNTEAIDAVVLTEYTPPENGIVIEG